MELLLEIDAEGRVTAARMTKPRGHGFDEAARAAALQFRFEPAHRGERALASKILHRYSFHLKEQVTSEPLATSVLRGRLRVAGGDAPLAGADLRLEKSGAAPRTLVTDAEGRFEAAELQPGNYRLTVTAEGFEPYSVTEAMAAPSPWR